jgi:hypothetical protein
MWLVAGFMGVSQGVSQADNFAVKPAIGSEKQKMNIVIPESKDIYYKALIAFFSPGRGEYTANYLDPGPGKPAGFILFPASNPELAVKGLIEDWFGAVAKIAVDQYKEKLAADQARVKMHVLPAPEDMMTSYLCPCGKETTIEDGKTSIRKWRISLVKEVLIDESIEMPTCLGCQKSYLVPDLMDKLQR